MSFSALASMTQDQALINRVAACVATEGAALPPDHPLAWAANHIWEVAATPGWADAYEDAISAENPAPGLDGQVITDPMILTAVRALIRPSE